VCSEPDADEVNRLHGVQRAHAIPNALPAPRTKAPLPGSKTVLLLGIYCYTPNRAAAEWLIHDIWPRVRRRCPDAQLWVAGRYEHTINLRQGLPGGVELLGFVDDLDALYARTQLVVCPILSGGGTRVKIIEAALHGRPVVSTPIGAEGLELAEARDEIQLASDADGFAEAVCDLLCDSQRAERVGAAARRRAEELYGADLVGAKLTRLLDHVARAGPPSARTDSGKPEDGTEARS
jgi:glycosyltransferase involved in cell wall biosynthesis